MNIVQIFKRARLYNKAAFRETREKIIDWHENLISQNGFLKDGILYLPESDVSDKDDKNLELVIIQDVDSDQGPPAVGLADTHQFSQNLPVRFEIFQFRRLEDGLEVWLRDDQKLIGTPARETHKIGVISSGRSLRYLVNGKFDGRTQRMIFEFDYIIEFLGTFSGVSYLKPPFPEIEKKIPQSQAKIVDERKLMY